MTSLHCLGASGEVGRSAFLLETDKKIMLDYGVKLFDESGETKYPLESVDPDYIILSHAHLDHSGAIPLLYRKAKMKWFATAPTRDIVELLWNDSLKIMGETSPYNKAHAEKALGYWTPSPYGQKTTVGETSFWMEDAGHVAGAGITNLEYKKKKICYSGDFKMEETYMHDGAKPVEDVDYLIIESTYALREHPPRKELERQFIDEIRETIELGGNVLLPAFAVGRTQELVSMIRHYEKDVPVFVDGMGKDITTIYRRYSKYIKDPMELKKAINSVRIVSSIEHKKIATKDPSVIITTAGMMNGGPVLNHLLHSLPNSKIIFTGYCVEGTNGWKLQHEGQIVMDGEELEVDLPVHYMDFSAHAGKKDILEFVKKANPEKIVLIHGDQPEKFRDELESEHGYKTYAPKIGDRIDF